MHPGCELNWAANTTLNNPITNIQRQENFDNNKNIE